MRRRSDSPLALAPGGALVFNVTDEVPAKVLERLCATIGVSQTEIYVGVTLRGAAARRALKRLDDACAEAVARERPPARRKRR